MTPRTPGFTDEVKQELASLPLGDDVELRAELAALVRVAGALTVRGGTHELVVDLESTSGATARRAFALLQRRYGARPELRVRAPGGVQRRTLYGVRLAGAGAHVAADLGLLDDAGRPTEQLAPPGSRAASTASLRGAFLGGGSISAPDRAPHLEIAVHRAGVGEQLVELVHEVVGGRAHLTSTDGRHRVVCKSGATIGELLASLGASGAYLRWEERRLRRQVRSDATRLANADAANLRRTVHAASSQVQAVEAVVAEVGWDGLEEDLRTVALARLANPDASLGELGELADPPCSKSAVHRRLRRLEELAAELAPPGGR